MIAANPAEAIFHCPFDRLKDQAATLAELVEATIGHSLSL